MSRSPGALVWMSVTLAACGVWMLAGERPLPEVPARTATAAAPDPAPAVRPRAPAAARSGRLGVDGAGRFVADRDALAWLRSFLYAHRDLEQAELAAALDRALRRALPEDAWPDARNLTARFLAFRAAARAELDDPALAESAGLERRLQWLRELRREHFGPELAEALFAEEEATLRVQLAMRRVRENDGLSPAARRQALDTLEAELPAPVRDTWARVTAPLRLAEEEEALRAAGAGEAEIQALREARVGPAAARRLTALDRERAVWKARVDAYRAEHSARIAGGADPDALRALRERHFEGDERARVERLEAVWRTSGAAGGGAAATP